MTKVTAGDVEVGCERRRQVACHGVDVLISKLTTRRWCDVVLAGGDVNGGVVCEEDVMDCEVVQSDVEGQPVEELVELAVER